jgi:hypothetical protein
MFNVKEMAVQPTRSDIFSMPSSFDNFESDFNRNLMKETLSKPKETTTKQNKTKL